MNTRGFTLVELMVALLILSIGLLGLATAAASLTRYHELATNRNEMTLLADTKLEQLRSAGTSRTADTTLLAVGGSLTTPVALHADSIFAPRGRRYTRLWVVVAGPGGTRSVTLRIRPLVDDVRTPARLDFTTHVLVL